MGRSGVRHDGELEAGLHRGVSSASSSSARHHGHHRTQLPDLTWPKFWRQPSSSVTRFNTSLRPVPEVYPLIAAVGVGCACAAVITYHDMRWNPEVLVRKDTRKVQVCTKDDEPSLFATVTKNSQSAYDHPLRRWVLGSKPWVFPWLEERATGISRRDNTIDLEKEKWRVAKSDEERE